MIIVSEKDKNSQFKKQGWNSHLKYIFLNNRIKYQ